MLNKLYEPLGHQTVVKYDVPKPIVYFTTFYLVDISKSLTEELKNIVLKFYPQIHLRILFKNCSTVGNSFSIKDKMPKELVSNIIYKYTCECCKAFYIGKVQKQFRCRISQHIGISVRTGATLSSKPHSEIRDHCFKCKTPILEDNFEILDRLNSKDGLLLLETLHQKIKKTKNRCTCPVYSSFMF